MCCFGRDGPTTTVNAKRRGCWRDEGPENGSAWGNGRARGNEKQWPGKDESASCGYVQRCALQRSPIIHERGTETVRGQRQGVLSDGGHCAVLRCGESCAVRVFLVGKGDFALREAFSRLQVLEKGFGMGQLVAAGGCAWGGGRTVPFLGLWEFPRELKPQMGSAGAETTRSWLAFAATGLTGLRCFKGGWAF